MADHTQEFGDDSMSGKSVAKLVTALVILAGTVTFILQNSQDVEIKFLTFSGDTPLYFVIVVSMILGALVFGILRVIWHRRQSRK